MAELTDPAAPARPPTIADRLARIVDHRLLALPDRGLPSGWYGPHRPSDTGDGRPWTEIDPLTDPERPVFGCVHGVDAAPPADAMDRVDRWRRMFRHVAPGGVLAISFPVAAFPAGFDEFVLELLDGSLGRLTLEDLTVHQPTPGADRIGQPWVSTVTRVLGPG